MINGDDMDASKVILVKRILVTATNTGTRLFTYIRADSRSNRNDNGTITSDFYFEHIHQRIMKYTGN